MDSFWRPLIEIVGPNRVVTDPEIVAGYRTFLALKRALDPDGILNPKVLFL